jgi:predicted dehydrogenase
VGLGRSGYGIHLKALRRLPDFFEVSAVADQITERSRAVAEELGISACEHSHAAFNRADVDLVVIATPSHMHASVALEAIKAGKNVVCEKPFGLNVREADAMLDAASSAHVFITAFYNRRFEETFKKVREVVSSGRIGRPLRIRMAWSNFARRWDWQTLREFGGGQLNNNGPHAIDQALALLRDCGLQDVAALRCDADLWGAFGIGDADDNASLKLVSDHLGTSVQVELFSTDVFPEPRWHVCGTAGSLTGGLNRLEWKWVGHAVTLREPSRTAPANRSYDSEEVQWSADSFIASDKFSDWSVEFYRALYGSLRGNSSFPISARDSRDVTWVLEQLRSAAGGIKRFS